MDRTRILIMGAAGRDFHDFNVVYREDPTVEVVAFTATQIPGIADRRYPPELAGPLYPTGIPILAESELERTIRDARVDLVVFAYSDVAHETVMHAASRVLATGADFSLLGPRRTMVASTRPVVATGATRTGAGKSQTTRYLARLIEEAGLTAVVIRHPMPYGDLVAQRCERFATYADLDRYETTIEEREEYEPHLDAGRIVYAGVDYEDILRSAEAETDVVVWDGVNNDIPFYNPDLFVVVVNKVDSADPEQVAMIVAGIAEMNPRAAIVKARSALTLEGGDIAGRSVVVVEDGPTLTHGGMTFGAGIVAADRFGASEIVDPRPYATGELKATLERYPDLDRLLPAMGYGDGQIRELEAALNAAPADVVLAATPIDLTRILHLDKPVVRVRYELEEVEGPSLRELLAPIVERARAARR